MQQHLAGLVELFENQFLVFRVDSDAAIFDRDLDLWLPVLTFFSIVYYAVGFFFRRIMTDMKEWGTVLINSGLALGVLISLTSLVLFEDTAGWYIILVAALFVVVTYLLALVAPHVGD